MKTKYIVYFLLIPFFVINLNANNFYPENSTLAPNTNVDTSLVELAKSSKKKKLITKVKDTIEAISFSAVLALSGIVGTVSRALGLESIYRLNEVKDIYTSAGKTVYLGDQENISISSVPYIVFEAWENEDVREIEIPHFTNVIDSLDYKVEENHHLTFQFPHTNLNGTEVMIQFGDPPLGMVPYVLAKIYDGQVNLKPFEALTNLVNEKKITQEIFDKIKNEGINKIIVHFHNYRSMEGEFTELDLLGDDEYPHMIHLMLRTPGSTLKLTNSQEFILNKGTSSLYKNFSLSPEGPFMIKDNQAITGTFAYHDEGIGGHHMARVVVVAHSERSKEIGENLGINDPGIDENTTCFYAHVDVLAGMTTIVIDKGSFTAEMWQKIKENGIGYIDIRAGDMTKDEDQVENLLTFATLDKTELHDVVDFSTAVDAARSKNKARTSIKLSASQLYSFQESAMLITIDGKKVLQGKKMDFSKLSKNDNIYFLIADGQVFTLTKSGDYIWLTLGKNLSSPFKSTSA